MNSLDNKKILLFCPQFFDYDRAIKCELENLGAKVDLFDDRPKNDFLTKVFLRLRLSKFFKNKISNYYKKILSSLDDQDFDYLFLVNPEAIDKSIIEKIRERFPRIIVLVYMWDSVSNKKNSLTLMDAANRFYSFDYEDTKNYIGINFLPLFYLNEYKSLKNKETYLYDTLFIGTLHSDRYNLVKSIQLESRNNLNYFYSPSRLLFTIQRIFQSSFKSISLEDVRFNSIGKHDLLDMISKSRVVIDIEHPNQNGLTMRTIEMLGAKKKIITTNKNVIKYDFFDSNNILVVDRANPVINDAFFKQPYVEIDKEIYDKYSLTKWLMTIFQLEHITQTPS